MPKTYGSTSEYLNPVTLSDETLTSIGRLVRATAEFEDIVDLYICNLAEINESKAAILLGRTALTRRLEIALQLAHTLGPHVVEIHKHAFSAEYQDIIDCRNAVAHGKLLGVQNDGSLAFLTANSATPENGVSIRIVASYLPETITALARMAEDAVPRLEQHLKVEALRAERLRRPLAPHRKARPRPPAKPQRPPQP